MDSRDIAIQPLKLSGDCGGAPVEFAANADGRTMSATITNGGRMRIYPDIPAFKKAKKFSSWKREVYVNPETRIFSIVRMVRENLIRIMFGKQEQRLLLTSLTKKATIVEP